MAEVFFIGQILGASEFDSHNLFCRWSLKSGSAWDVEAGDTSGQTQLDSPAHEPYAHWAHPIDIHLRTKGLQGWPKLALEIYHQDNNGLLRPVGYTFAHMPTSAGTHELSCHVWAPLGTPRDDLVGRFMQVSPQLTSLDTVFTASESAGRYKLRTRAMGQVHLRISVITRNFDRFGIES